MDNKIYMDSGVVITLGKLHAFCNNRLKNSGDYSKVKSIIETHKSYLHEALQRDVNILDYDVSSILDLYVGIMNQEIVACVPPFVFKEIAMDTSRGALTKDFFKHCYLVLPQDEMDALTMPVKTISLDRELKGVESVDPSGVSYGLNPDSHTKDGNQVDVNIEDRWIVSQINYLSELGDDNLRFISGSEIFYPSSYEAMTPDGEACKSIVSYLYEETLKCHQNFEKEEYQLQEFLGIYEPVVQKNVKKKSLFLHQNEKDYGRIYNGINRKKTHQVTNENSQRDVKAMDSVTRQIQEIASNTKVVTYDNSELKQFLENVKTSDYERIL